MYVVVLLQRETPVNREKGTIEELVINLFQYVEVYIVVMIGICGLYKNEIKKIKVVIQII